MQTFQLTVRLVSNSNVWAAIFFPCHPYIKSTTVLSGLAVHVHNYTVFYHEYTQNTVTKQIFACGNMYSTHHITIDL